MSQNIKLRQLVANPLRGVNNEIMQKGFSTILVIIAVIGFFAFSAGIYYLKTQKSTTVQNTKQDTPQKTTSSTSSSSQVQTTFQTLLGKNCLNQSRDKQLSGEIALDTLPLTIKLSALKNKGNCDSDFAKYVKIPLGEENSFITISDKNSYYCCSGPSSLEPAGKLIMTSGDISIYIHTGTWGDGPNSGYKPIVARGVKSFKLNNGEEIRVVLDRIALDKNDPSLQKVEDKYQIIDPNFDSGAKVLTPDTVDKMFMDTFF